MKRYDAIDAIDAVMNLIDACHKGNVFMDKASDAARAMAQLIPLIIDAQETKQTKEPSR